VWDMAYWQFLVRLETIYRPFFSEKHDTGIPQGQYRLQRNACDCASMWSMIFNSECAPENVCRPSFSRSHWGAYSAPQTPNWISGRECRDRKVTQRRKGKEGMKGK